MIYQTITGDMVDDIAWRHYRGAPGATELLLSVNPGLANEPTPLPAGILILLPDYTAPADQETIHLWD
jgi:phage tail protein X